ncbi:hypothetical protein [Bifidobacterium callitrichos]|uniref:Peptidase n=1 Tax=Bifidobacterium callitrichos DSM 23973 TaxID=1437609 RepID=A0A086ZVR5_9BIFI|nr:hypothetical protein [Bifidobacterium callitrichos]KFI50615.1 peptidase [Bifidobacterium callitrichos DSM 23973]
MRNDMPRIASDGRWRRPLVAGAALLVAAAMIAMPAGTAHAVQADAAAGVVRSADDGASGIDDGDGDERPEPEQPDPDKPTPEPEPEPNPEPEPEPEPNPEPEPEPEPGPTQSEPKATSPTTQHKPVGVGSTIADTFDVTGFPDDHTTVDGDKANVTVTLWWWSGGANFDTIKAEDLFSDLNRPVGNEEPYEDRNHKRIGSWEYPAVNGRIRIGDGEEGSDGKPVTITVDKPGWYVFMWRFDGDDRAKAAATRFDDLGHAHVVIADGEQVDDPEEPGPAPNPNPEPEPGEPDDKNEQDGGDAPAPDADKQNGDGGDVDILKQISAQKYGTGKTLAKTGVNVGAIILIVVSTLGVGAFMLVVIRRHKA